ncbi:MAG: type II toxin-antitoxin system HicA family toxin [Methylacidiphilales bacterium]|nr:type II toxin-antitoxin system HicA family toxin [Candidatus Methylacidiphilales bacterium]
MKAGKIHEKMLAGSLNIRFADLCKVAGAFGYRLDRVSGSHHIFEHPQASRPLNFQNDRGQAKPYQIRQFLRDVKEFHLSIDE